MSLADQRSSRSFAVVPAAGLSTRMGRAKLLLPWRGGTLLEHVLKVWLASAVERVVVVVRPDDTALRACCAALPVDIVVPPFPPAEMKVSVQLALQHIRRQYGPRDGDAWLLAPADMPALSAVTIRQLLAAREADRDAVVAPIYAGRRRGHPVVFPWRQAAAAEQLRRCESLRTLVERNRILEVPVDDSGVLQDIDTPADYQALIARDRSAAGPQEADS